MIQVARFSESKFRIATGGFKYKGRAVGGVRLDPQQKSKIRSGEAKLVKSKGPSGFALKATPKGRKMSKMRVAKWGKMGKMSI